MVSDIAPSDLPEGSSPDNQDVAFQVGLVKTRPGLQNVFTPIGGNPTVNYLKTFITEQQVLRMMALDSLGNVYKENPIGTLQAIGSVEPSEYGKSTSQFAREYMAFSDGKFGFDMPRQYDDTNFDRVSQVGPGAPPTVTDENNTVNTQNSPNGLEELFGSTIVASPGGLSEIGNIVTAQVTIGSLIPSSLLLPGDQIQVSGAGISGYNGTFTLLSASPDGLSLTYYNPTTGLANSGGGSINFSIVFVNLQGPHNLPVSSTLFTFNIPQVTIAGAGVAGYNGTWPVRQVLNSTQLYINITSFALAFSGGATFVVAGNIAAGKHQLSVCFKTRQGYITAPSAATITWTAAGNKRAVVSGIPIGPPNITARILIFTVSGGSSFYYLIGGPTIGVFGANFIINDNTTTTVTVDFTDAILAAGTSADYLFKLVELGECSGVIDYSQRLFWWGERNKVNNFVNLTFDGGFTNPGSSPNFPLGWMQDATFASGGGSALAQSLAVVWGDAYAITGNGSAVTRGLITQSAYQDVNQVNLIQPNTAYSVRARIRGNRALTQGTLHIHLFSTSAGINSTGLTLTAAQTTTAYTEYIATLTAAIPTPPTDLVLRIYADGTPINGDTWLVDNVEIFPTTQPYNTSQVRGSRVEDPESYDGVNGFMLFSENDGTRMTAAFKIRNNLYFSKERSLWQTADDGVNEPSKWAINPISSIVGTPSINGVGVGSDWVVIASRLGLYYFDGGEPQKISQEIQKTVVSNDGSIKPGWDSINWQYGHTIWVQVDEKNRRILVGVPVNGATSPNVVFVLDYRGLDTGSDITSHKSVHISAYTGKLYDIADGRKWTRWNMTINSAGQIERPDGTFHLFMGNGSSTGKIYDLLDVENFANPAAFGDDGVAINSYYETYHFIRPEQELAFQLGAHRKLFYYLTSYIEGQGTPALTAFPLGNFPGTPIPQSGNALPPLVSLIFPVNISSISRTNNVVTVATASNHNLSATNNAVIAGTGNATFDGKVFGNLTIINPTAFSFPLTGPNIGTINAGTVNPLARDLEVTINVLTERCRFRFGTNALGSFFNLRNLTVSLRADPWIPVRGIN